MRSHLFSSSEEALRVSFLLTQKMELMDKTARWLWEHTLQRMSPTQQMGIKASAAKSRLLHDNRRSGWGL
ncbi:hypothetical protein C4D60_Mb08t01440 [Musa balbisiana]|uniref:Uncharacterized protein n=1 Tax=Musa balbisiana TaxID=52838 RepID=A0A4S8K0N3_MUSBA|nr:hypothetical protein C4D60_Mb08t01440 [Musa balbisiana]